jgi:hypothetical protein
MSWPSFGLGRSASSGTDDVRSAISRAAQRTGVDFGYLFNQAKSESGLNPHAQASGSSAGGLFQFIDQSWLGAVKIYGAKHGMGWAADAISRSKSGTWTVDPAVKDQVMALKNQPEASSLMAAEFASDNADGLRNALGRTPRAADLYFAHFLGLEGAAKFLKVNDSNPDAIAASLFPREARSNRGIFYGADGSARSMGEVYALMARKISDNGSPLPNNAPGDLSPTIPAMSSDRMRLAYAREVFEGDGKNSTADMLAMIGNQRTNLLRPTPGTAMLAYMMLASDGDGSISDSDSETSNLG